MTDNLEQKDSTAQEHSAEKTAGKPCAPQEEVEMAGVLPPDNVALLENLETNAAETESEASFIETPEANGVETDSEVAGAETPEAAEQIVPSDGAEENAAEPQQVFEGADAEDVDDLAGFSENRDAYGREILDRNFVNLLTMAKNTVKRNYSRIKNAIFSYKEVKTVYEGECELVRHGKEILFRFAISEEGLSLSLAIPADAIDKKVYPHKLSPKEEPYGKLQVVVSVGNKPSVMRAVELISLVMDMYKIEKTPAGNMVAYAAKYPVNLHAVLSGEEEIPPEEGQYAGEEYADVTEGVLAEIMEEKQVARKKGETAKGAEELEIRRQTATTVKGALAIQEPIVYFYDVAVDKDSNPAYINIQQVLNDKFLGKLLPEQYFAIAEGSERIEMLNLLCIAQAVVDCNLYGQYLFVVQLSCRMLMKPDNVKRLIKAMKTEKSNLVFAFDAALLETLAEVGKAAVAELRTNGAKILLDNSEQAGMRALTDYDYDFLRFDSRYYAEINKKQTAHLAMLTGYAKTMGIITSAASVGTMKDALYFLMKGVEIIGGYIVSEPKRIIQIAVKERKKLPQIRG